MVIPLASRQRWLFLGLAILIVAYVALVGRQFVASDLAFRPGLANLQRAARLLPGNADYRHRLGRYFTFVAPDPQAALNNYRAAVSLNPHQARYWFDLAAAQQVVGDLSGQRDALEHALQAEPT